METIVNNISTGNKIDTSIYYKHSFEIEENIFKNILSHGLKCNILRRSKSQGNNGPFYISTFKGKCSDNNLLRYLEKNPLLVIDDKIRICTTKERFMSFINSVLPFRYSPYENEYQKFLIIRPKYFLAIEYYLDSSDPNIKKKLITLKQLMIWADSINNDIQFINSFNSEIISKDKVKKYINI